MCGCVMIRHTQVQVCDATEVGQRDDVGQIIIRIYDTGNAKTKTEPLPGTELAEMRPP